MKEEQNSSVEDQVFNTLVDAMLGRDWSNEEVRQKKIMDLKNGKYKNLMISIYPKELNLWPHAP